MIAVDTNLLVYAHRQDSDFHKPAITALKALAESNDRWSIPWPCVHEFLAITTHPKIFNPPSPLKSALEAMDVWLNSHGCEMIGEDPGYYDVLKNIVSKGKVTGPMIHDARIAALCLHHGIRELWTTDRDFSRFASLRTRNPLGRD